MTAPPKHPLVELRRAGRTFGTGKGRVAALSNASLRIARGDFVAVVGRSGSGKSTLMNLIGLLDNPSQGELLVDGIRVDGLSPGARAELRNRHIGFVFQAYHLMPRRSALANVALPLVYRGARRRARMRRAADALANVGLAARANALPGQMSGGEQQRVAIARALVTDPDLIIADEPTGALDTAASELVLLHLEAACAAGRTVVMVTHDLTVAARARRQVQLSDGCIVADSQFPDRVQPQDLCEVA